MIQQVEKLKEIINQNSMGHLPLPYRVDLMKQISDICIVQKVLCECCKKVCSCFTKEYDNENPLYSVLSEIDSYLYKNKGHCRKHIGFGGTVMQLCGTIH